MDSPTNRPPIPSLNNTFCYSRDKELSLYGRLPRRMEGACLTVLRYMVIYANHSPGYYAGHLVSRGEIVAAQTHLSGLTGLSRKTIRNAIEYLLECKLIEQKGAIKGASGANLYVIVNYEDWDGSRKTGPAKGPARGQQGATSKEEEGRKKEGFLKETAYPAEARGALEIWMAIAPLPETASEDAALKTLTELNRIDDLSWDQINRICAHAAKFWVPGRFIASPAKLRKPTKSGEMKTWEAIERQLSASHQNGIHPPAHPITAASTAAPTTSLRALHLANTHQPTSPPPPSLAPVIAAELVGDAP